MSVSSALSLAEAVVRQAGRERPADDVLREKLRAAHRLDREMSTTVARWVFGYYRWRGFLARGLPLQRQILAAAKLTERYAAEPDSFKDDFLGRAVPSWVSAHVDATPAWWRSLQREPALWLRSRPGTADALAKRLGDCLRPLPDRVPDALVYDGCQDLHRTEVFQEGAFEIQDLASQIVGVLCAPQSRETWWDACAGEGGKTLHLADSMANQGVVWATDRADWRLDRLRLRAARAGLFNIRWANWDGRSKRPFAVQCDGVLVDAPCSGVGTWQRNPHARWTVELEDLTELAAIQLGLMRNVVPAVKPGGRLIYAVCSLTRQETSEVAETFGKESGEFEPLNFPEGWRRGTGADDRVPAHHLWLWPQDWGGNGMFLAAWRRRS